MGEASRVSHGNIHLQSNRLEAQGSAEGRRVGIRTGSHSHLEQGEMEQAIHADQQGHEGRQARADTWSWG